ncbi:hypothetical protein LX36DRAFT_247775 [Colletotrichum falcatum]|nr:hypothetical protein LX36DRAFT_247775 [Colletotrichum falcatum]
MSRSKVRRIQGWTCQRSTVSDVRHILSDGLGSEYPGSGVKEGRRVAKYRLQDLPDSPEEKERERELEGEIVQRTYRGERGHEREGEDDGRTEDDGQEGSNEGAQNRAHLQQSGFSDAKQHMHAH